MNVELMRRVAGLTPAKRVLLERKLGAGLGPTPKPQPAVRDGGLLPASFGQRSQWFLHRLEPGSVAFNKTHAVRIRGPLQVAALDEALRSLIDRHEVLRTTIVTREGEPMQLVGDASEFRLSVVDLSDQVDGGDKLPLAVRHAIAMERLRPFDLERDLMYRATVLRLGPEDHVLTRTSHHAAFDRWSVAIANRELSELYQAEIESKAPDLEALALQYGDYAIWQRTAIDGQAMAPRLEYFSAHLAGAAHVLDLITDRPRPDRAGQQGATLRHGLPADLVADVRQLARSEGATPFMVMLAVFGALLGRYARVDELLVGVPVAGRPHRELEDLIGLFINTVVMRVDLREDPTFQEVTTRIRSATLGAMTHQDLPFDRLVQELAGERDPRFTPLFQVMFDYINTPNAPLRLGDLELQEIPVEDDAAVHDITLYVYEADAGMDLIWEYRTDLFDRATIVQLSEAYQTLLGAVVQRPERPLADLPLLARSGEAQVAAVASGRHRPAGQDATVVEMFRARVAADPDAVAIRVGGDRALTYGQVSGAANQLGHHLIDSGVGAGDRIGLLLDRSVHLVTALLGTVGIGAVAVLMDRSLPPDRLRMMMSDAGVVALVTGGETPTDIDPPPIHVDLAADGSLLETLSSEPPPLHPGPDSPMYVVFTSGSTGRPKGVLVAHRSVANLVADAIDRYDIEPVDRVLQFAAPGFDTLIEEILPALGAGASIVIRPPDLFPTFDAFEQFVEREQVTVLDLPTAWWHAWVDELDRGAGGVPKAVRLVIVGGEAAASDRWRAWRRVADPRMRWVNTYGPAEATVVVATFEPAPDWAGPVGRSVPIGGPIDNAHLMIVDRRGHPMPPRMPGELVIGGLPVGLGYVGEPAAAHGGFDPRGGPNGEPVFWTGDLARRLEDGTIEFLGRVDSQIKVRGVRVEPMEVESALRSHPDIAEAVVVPRMDNGSTGLTAHLVAAGPVPEVEVLQSHLAGILPQQMVPTEWHFHADIPTGATGKIDRRLLVQHARRAGSSEQATPRDPATETERTLMELWMEVLEQPSLSVGDDFFALGGHSLLGVRLLSRVSEAWEVDLPLRTIYDAPTVEAMAQLIDAARAPG